MNFKKCVNLLMLKNILWKNSCCFLQNKWQKCSEIKRFLPCFPYWKGLNVPPRDSQCLLEFSQPVGLSYCLTFSPHLFFFNSHRAPNRILLPLKVETLLGPCNILTHLESWEPVLKKITIFSIIDPSWCFSNQSFTFLSSGFQMYIIFIEGH